MIVFDLRCAAGGHVFEGWFASTADYDGQQARGLVSCPICGTSEVAKAPMAPGIPAKSNTAPAGRPAAADLFSGAPEEVKSMLAAAAALQKKLLEKSESVGDRFAEEARSIHLGEAKARPIHGRATPEQAASLVEEGVPIAPLPFPVVEPGKEN